MNKWRDVCRDWGQIRVRKSWVGDSVQDSAIEQSECDNGKDDEAPAAQPRKKKVKEVL